MAPPAPTHTVEDEEEAPRTGAFVGLFVVLLAVLLVLLFLLGRMVGLFGSGNPTPKVGLPNLVGRPLDDATAQLRALGLAFDVNPPGATGTVTKQDPPAGDVDKDTTVHLTVGPGAPATATVPDVRNQPEANARQALEDAGFQVQATQSAITSAAPGTVVAQDPPGGTAAPKGSTVKITVAAARSTIPNVTGEPADQATADLQRAGVTNIRQTQEASSTIPAGSVVRTDPAAGQPVPANKTVTMVVSSGPAASQVPGVIGLTRVAATQRLQQAGYQVQVQQRDVSDSSQNGKVLDQSPAPGQPAARGSTVNIVVGRFVSSSSSSPSSSSSSSSTTAGATTSTT